MEWHKDFWSAMVSLGPLLFAAHAVVVLEAYRLTRGNTALGRWRWRWRTLIRNPVYWGAAIRYFSAVVGLLAAVGVTCLAISSLSEFKDVELVWARRYALGSVFAFPVNVLFAIVGVRLVERRQFRLLRTPTWRGTGRQRFRTRRLP